MKGQEGVVFCLDRRRTMALRAILIFSSKGQRRLCPGQGKRRANAPAKAVRDDVFDAPGADPSPRGQPPRQKGGGLGRVARSRAEISGRLPCRTRSEIISQARPSGRRRPWWCAASSGRGWIWSWHADRLGPRRRRVARSAAPAGAGRHRWTNSHVGARPQQRHRPVGNHDGRHEPAHAQIRTRSSIGTPSATSRRRASGLRRIENVHLDIVRTSEAVKAGALKAAAAPAADHWVVLTERMTV